MMRIAVVALTFGLVACGKTAIGGAAGSSDAGVPVAASASQRQGVADAARPSVATEWHGAYHSIAGTLYVPPGWKGVHWDVPENATGLGGGSMVLRVRDGRRISGELIGPLGPALVDGAVSDSTVTARIIRKDPADRGYEGTLIGTIDGGTLHGTMNVSLGEASAIRTVTFSLSHGS